MYRTVRHGENSLQYTILPQQDDLGSSGAAAGAGHVTRRTRKAGGGRLKLALVLGVAFVLAAGAVTTAVLVPLMIPRPHGAGHRAITRHHHPPQNLLPVRRPLHQPQLEDPAPPPVAAAHLAEAPTASTEPASQLPASSVSPAEDPAVSGGLYSEPPATEAMTSTPAATSTQAATTTTTTTTSTTTTTTTTTPAPTTAASTAAATASTAGFAAVTEPALPSDNGTDGGAPEEPDGDDDADVDGPSDGGRGRGRGQLAGTWLGTRWPFGDASAYFEWTGFNGEDSVLLPLLLAGVVLVLVVLVAACYAIRRHRHKRHRRSAIGKMSNELQSGDKATLLPDGSEDE